MTAPVEIIIQWDVGQLSPNRRMCWQERMRLTRDARAAAFRGWCIAGSPRIEQPVVVEITLRRNRLLDPDNALACCKAIIDELFVGKITPYDAARWLRFGEVCQEQIPKRSPPVVVVRVTPQHAAAADDGGCPAAAPADREKDDSLSPPEEP